MGVAREEAVLVMVPHDNDVCGWNRQHWLDAGAWRHYGGRKQYAMGPQDQQPLGVGLIAAGVGVIVFAAA